MRQDWTIFKSSWRLIFLQKWPKYLKIFENLKKNSFYFGNFCKMLGYLFFVVNILNKTSQTGYQPLLPNLPILPYAVSCPQARYKNKSVI